ncbi:actin cortical patch SUR7/pH-response regulator pali [Xylaria bambusicola]|uniref:actin cortical patch SUR7/pH-response regulator pali n=1 Tax=Xylaria bambusicola TaxID=326684 RepID=UPI002007FDD4|nr:actin cortical patch SUR7/pH-response regulator pali [Xylaria bambusicola]KAI0523666.1 actin cortical patch SUR7/pH-response regulator pali [Xylaria bambusicola]
MVAPRQPSVGLLLPPVLISFVAFVLAMIALLAGTGPQQESLEPYHLIAVNLSNFGQDLIASSTTSDPKPTETSGGSLFDDIADDVRGLGQDITDGINNLTNGVADKITEELGISEWYSLHIMSICEGMFSPNASAPGAWYNMTNCTTQQPLRLNLSAILDHEIKAGPLNLNINQIPIPDSVQNAVDTVNDAIRALLVIYALASGLTGLTFLVSLAVVVLFRKRVHMLIVWANMSISGLGALVLLIGSAVVTYVNNKAIKEIDDAGKDVGISGIRGSKFITLSWISFGLMLFISLYWTVATLKYTQRWIIIADRPRLRSKKILP